MKPCIRFIGVANGACDRRESLFSKKQLFYGITHISSCTEFDEA